MQWKESCQSYEDGTAWMKHQCLDTLDTQTIFFNFLAKICEAVYNNITNNCKTNVNCKGVEIMAEQVLIQFRADKELKREVTEIYESLGMDLPTAFRMFMNKSKLVRGIPFDVRLPEKTVTREEVMKAFEDLRSQASDLPEMSLDEINEEIRAARAERRERNK